MEHVEVEGLRIAFERTGSGPALVLLHGGLSDRREWRRQLEGLSDARTVVAWDAPGCGGSDDPPPTFRLPDYARILAGFLDAIRTERAAVLGSSWGSTLALELYRRRPDVPSALILTAAYAGWAGSLPPEVVRERLAAGLRDLESSPAELVRAWLPSLLTDRAPAEVREELAGIISGSRPKGAVPMLHSMAEADLRDVLPTIRVETLLLYGERDERSSPSVAETMLGAIPGSRLLMLADTGHLSNMESPEAFNDAVRGFLDEV